MIFLDMQVLSKFITCPPHPLRGKKQANQGRGRNGLQATVVPARGKSEGKHQVHVLVSEEDGQAASTSYLGWPKSSFGLKVKLKDTFFLFTD